MNQTLSQVAQYDVIIMGAGFAGICQARHLLLRMPDLKIAIIDPRSEDRQVKDMKLGESMVEVAALFVGKELGLYEYLIENHTPKSGLHFHWPREVGQTKSLDDYYHVWSNRQPPIGSFHMNRAKFEGDVLKMVIKMGATFINGRVVDVELTPGDHPNGVTVKVGDSIQSFTTEHLIDAAGNKFIIGHKTDNVVNDPESLFGHTPGSTWVRVKNVNRERFDACYNPTRMSSSVYYATNHFFGQGHWLWMIPTDRDSMELSVGVVYHHDVIPSETINTKDKFYAFLAENHTILHELVSTAEDIDFHHRPKVGYKSKVMFSPDNWYVTGDAAYIFDAFYSYGSSTIAFATEGITELIRSKRSKEADFAEKRELYNQFNVVYADNVNHLFRYHNLQLGHASVMSWRIYLEYMFWFGIHVPMYIGKWHLDPNFVRRFNQQAPINTKGFLHDVYQQFNQLVERGANIGLMDAYRGDQLLGNYSPLKHFDDYIENAKYEPRRVNVFAGMKKTYLYVALWYLLFQWKGFGLAGVLNPRHLYHVFRLLGLSAQLVIAEQIYKSKVKHLSSNTNIAKMREEFKQYKYRNA